MTTFRRFILLAMLALWQGGFVFYGAVVVPIGQSEIGDQLQGSITRRVTTYLNWTGVAAVLPMAWDTLAVREAAKRRRMIRLALIIILAVSLAVLFRLHGNLSELIDLKATAPNQSYFRLTHSAYLCISTLQWVLALAFGVVSLQSWRGEDWNGGLHVSEHS